MTAPSHLGLNGQPVNRRRLRRMSRQFAAVGVTVPAARLAQIASGCPATENERVDVAFARAATLMRHEQSAARRTRAKRRCVHSAIVVMATVIALVTVVCLGLGFFLMAQHVGPF